MARPTSPNPTLDATLPPAGDERREELQRRADDLAERAEAASVEGGAIRPDAFRVENEIAQHFDLMEVPHADPAFVYKWVNADLHKHYGNRFVLQARAEGWEVVRASDADAEGMEHARHPDGTVVVGDVILLRCRRDRHRQLQQAERDRATRLAHGAEAELHEIADRARSQGLGVTVHSGETSPDMLRRMASRATAQGIAASAMDTMIRSGRVPGLPAGRR